jgi:acetyl esterase/lipase
MLPPPAFPIQLLAWAGKYTFYILFKHPMNILRPSQKLIITALVAIMTHCAFCQEEIPLWEDGAPGALGNDATDRPYLTVFLPPAGIATGAAILICPGGAYGGVVMTYEGVDVAEWYSEAGITGIVLYYRTAPYKFPVPLNDVRRAIRILHSNAGNWNLDTARIGVLGFSAGGHLASMAAGYGDNGVADTTDIIEQFSSKPDFNIFIYPVITMEPEFTHTGSQQNLAGDNLPQSLIDSLSGEKLVSNHTAPSFLVHGIQDEVVPVENSRMFYDSCISHDVPAKFYEIFSDCGYHGFGLNCGNWADTSITWLKQQGFMGTAVAYYKNYPQSWNQSQTLSRHGFGKSSYFNLQGRKTSSDLAAHLIRLSRKSGIRISNCKTGKP